MFSLNARLGAVAPVVFLWFLLACPADAGVTNIVSHGYYATIVQAVASASNGDILLVSAGTYAETVDVTSTDLVIDGSYSNDFSGKSAARTVVDVSGIPTPGSVIDVTNASVTLIDLDLTGGNEAVGGVGGGLHVVLGTVTARTCRIYGNGGAGTTAWGGGAMALSSTLVLDGTAVSGNSAVYGGGIYGYYSHITLAGASPVFDNAALMVGGGIRILNGSLLIDNTSADVYGNTAENGGGIAVTNAPMELRAAADVYDNLAEYNGGGILLEAGSIGVIHDVGTRIGYSGAYGPNSSSNGNGGGIYLSGATLIVSNGADIAHNVAASCGGGIFATNSSVLIADGARIGVFVAGMSNVAVYGGGMYAVDSTVVLSNATVLGCKAEMNGGGIYAVRGTLSVMGGTIGSSNALPANTAGRDGAGCYLIDTPCDMLDAAVLGNSARDDAGGVYLQDSARLTCSNCMFVGNGAVGPPLDSSCGGAIYALIGQPALSLYNTLLLSNSAFDLGGAIFWQVTSPFSAYGGTMGYNQAGYGGALDKYSASTATFDSVTIQYNAATDSGGALGVHAGRLVCIDCDIRSNIAAGGVGGGIWADTGANVLLFASAANTSLDANEAEDGGGLFASGSSSVSLIASTGRSLSMNSNIARNNGGGMCVENLVKVGLYGDVQMTGNIATNDGGAGYASNQCSIVAVTNTAGVGLGCLENTAGFSGGGFCILGPLSTQTLAGATFGGTVNGNRATGPGGAIAVLYGAHLDVFSSLFQNNVSSNSGGAVFANSSSSAFDSGPAGILPGTQFINNNARFSGGALYFIGATSTVMNVLLANNGTLQRGGAVYMNTDSRVRCVNAVIVSNRALLAGGGVRPNNAEAILEHCTIAQNDSGVELSGSALATLTNCIVWGNTATNIGAGAVAAVYSDIGGGFAGTGNLNADPAFASPALLDYRLTAGSPCVDSGVNCGVTSDCIGAHRPLGLGYDMGAYEFDPAPVLSVTPTLLAFGSVVVGDSSNLPLLVRNTGNSLLSGVINNVPVPTFTAAPGSYTLAPAAATNVVVTFAPSVEYSWTQTIVFASNGGTTDVTLTGTGIPEPMSVAAFGACCLLVIRKSTRALVLRANS